MPPCRRAAARMSAVLDPPDGRAVVWGAAPGVAPAAPCRRAAARMSAVPVRREGVAAGVADEAADRPSGFRATQPFVPLPCRTSLRTPNIDGGTDAAPPAASRTFASRSAIAGGRISPSVDSRPPRTSRRIAATEGGRAGGVPFRPLAGEATAAPSTGCDSAAGARSDGSGCPSRSVGPSSGLRTSALGFPVVPLVDPAADRFPSAARAAARIEAVEGRGGIGGTARGESARGTGGGRILDFARRLYLRSNRIPRQPTRPDRDHHFDRENAVRPH